MFGKPATYFFLSDFGFLPLTAFERALYRFDPTGMTRRRLNRKAQFLWVNGVTFPGNRQ